MTILVTGLCTLHWGRLEYGNAGNYYIIEPLFRELKRVFPDSELLTTFQMTKEFSDRESVTILPMEIYYGWKEDDLSQALCEYGSAMYFYKYSELVYKSAYIEWIMKSDIIINVSGDMWGDNAEHVGHNRFLVDLLKMRTAQLLGKRTVLFAGTPGPFSDKTTRDFAKEVFENFDFVPNREELATSNLDKWGFNTAKVRNFACPSFLFQTDDEENTLEVFRKEEIPLDSGKPLIGFTICGFNMPQAPYDVWPRDDSQYTNFAEAVEFLINNINSRVVLISHTNGFDLPPRFALKNGRDYPINKQLQNFVYKRNLIKDKNDLMIINHPYPPRQLKGIIGHFDMFVTGRLHASVAAISQYVPTVFIMHGIEFIRSTKIQGFARMAGVEEFVCEPSDSNDIITKIDMCWKSRNQVKKKLQITIPLIKEKAQRAIDEIGFLLQ